MYGPDCLSPCYSGLANNSPPDNGLPLEQHPGKPTAAYFLYYLLITTICSDSPIKVDEVKKRIELLFAGTPVLLNVAGVMTNKMWLQ